MRKVLLLALCMLLAVPVSAKVLVITSRVDNHPNGVKSILDNNRAFMLAHIVQGWEYDVVLASDTTLVRTMAQSGDYECALWHNLPEFSTAINEKAELLAVGMGKFIDWIGPNDYDIPIPLLLPLPMKAYTTVTFLPDSTGLDATNTTNTANYQPFLTDTDSLYMQFAAANYGALVDTVTALDNTTKPQALMWMPCATCTDDSIPVAAWMYTKRSGADVVIWQHGGYSAMFGMWLTAISMYESGATPADVVINTTYGYVAADSTRMADGWADLIGWVNDNDFKLTVGVDASWLRKVAIRYNARLFGKMLLEPDNYDFTHFTYTAPNDSDWAGYYVNHSSGSRKAGIQLAWDSTEVNYFIPTGTLDTSRVYALYGKYGGNAGYYEATEILSDLHTAGIRDMLGVGTYGERGWPSNPARGIENTQRFYMGTDLMTSRISMGYAVGLLNSTDADTLTAAKRANTMSALLPRMCGGSTFIGSSAYDYSSTDHGARVAQNFRYAPGPEFVFRYGKKREADAAGTYLVNADAMGASNLEWLIRRTAVMIDFWNGIARRYGTSGVMPLRNVHMKDVKWDRKNDKKWPNSHVRPE